MTHTHQSQEDILAHADENERPLLKEAFEDEDGLMESMHVQLEEKPEVDKEVAQAIHEKIQNNTLHTKAQIHTSVVEVMLKHIKPGETHGKAA